MYLFRCIIVCTYISSLMLVMPSVMPIFLLHECVFFVLALFLFIFFSLMLVALSVYIFFCCIHLPLHSCVSLILFTIYFLWCCILSINVRFLTINLCLFISLHLSLRRCPYFWYFQVRFTSVHPTSVYDKDLVYQMESKFIQSVCIESNL